MAKIYHLFKVDKNKIQPCCVAHVVHSILNNIVDPGSCVTMLNNIVDNHNIVQSVPINLKQVIFLPCNIAKLPYVFSRFLYFIPQAISKSPVNVGCAFLPSQRERNQHIRASSLCSFLLTRPPHVHACSLEDLGCVKIIGYIVMLRARMFRSLI